MSTCLRYFSPAQSSWNLAHILRLLPESHALFVSPEGCSRIILLSAAAQGMSARFSTLNVPESDVIAGGLEERIVEAAERVFERYKPRALFIVTSCIADFVALDREVFFEELRARHPETVFLDARMDPINRKSGLPPIVRMHKLLASVFERESEERAVNVLGSFTPPEDGQELFDHLRAHGFEIRHAYRCTDFDTFRTMGCSQLNLVMHPSALMAARETQARLDIPYVDLCAACDEASLEAVYADVCRALELPIPDLAPSRARCLEALRQLKAELGNRPLRLDDGYARRSDILTLALCQGGVPVEHLFASGLSEDMTRVLVQAGVSVSSSDAPECAFDRERYRNSEAVCAGDYAAWVSDSTHYALGLTFSSRFGLGGLERTARELTAACRQEKALGDMRHCGAGCFGL